MKRLYKLTLYAIALAAMSTAASAATFEDRLLDFHDTGILAAQYPSLYWITNTKLLINAESSNGRSSESTSSIQTYDLESNKSTVVKTEAWTLCLEKELGFAVVLLGKPGNLEKRRALLTPDGSLTITNETVSLKECGPRRKQSESETESLRAAIINAQRFFKKPGTMATARGAIIFTGVYDPYGRDTFFIEGQNPPVRIYKNRGSWDQIGEGSVSPDGCNVVLSLMPAGPIMALFSAFDKAPATLHTVNICSAFNQTTKK